MKINENTLKTQLIIKYYNFIVLFIALFTQNKILILIIKK